MANTTTAMGKARPFKPSSIDRFNHWVKKLPVRAWIFDALHFLQRGNIQRGQRILIHGAGGSIGTFAIQLAKHFGAEVAAVDSTAKLDMLRSLGADQVIDYTREDFTKRDEVYDVIFDVVGTIFFT